jgi:hypothetical protein
LHRAHDAGLARPCVAHLASAAHGHERQDGKQRLHPHQLQHSFLDVQQQQGNRECRLSGKGPDYKIRSALKF